MTALYRDGEVVEVLIDERGWVPAVVVDAYFDIVTVVTTDGAEHDMDESAVRPRDLEDRVIRLEGVIKNFINAHDEKWQPLYVDAVLDEARALIAKGDAK